MGTQQPSGASHPHWPEGSTVQRRADQPRADLASTASLEHPELVLSPSKRVAEHPPDDPEDQAATVIRRPGAGSSAHHGAHGSAATPADVAQVLLGSRLSHFHVEQLIGGGGMGAVFRARDERLDRTVAIKVIPFIGDDPDMQRRFRNEAQAAARLDHPNIARVFDVGTFEGWRYIVFEYIEGTNLRDLVADQGVLTIDDAVFYTRQIAEALHHASGRGVVHRDVKPSNVLVNAEGDIKLVDMGLARSDQLDMSGDMTASGVTLGTFDYISPEQARDPRDADVRSDIYSLGCTLYFVLTGEPPYPGGTMLQKLLNHGNAPPPDPSLVRPDVSDDLKAIIHKMLAKSPSARYQRAIDLVADLRELANREGLERARSQGTVAIPRESLSRGLVTHLPWLVAAMLLLLGAVSLQLLATLRGDAFVIDVPSSAVTLRPAASLADRSVDSAAAVDPPSATGSVERDVAAEAEASAAAEDDTSLAGRDAAELPPRYSALNGFPSEPRATTGGGGPAADRVEVKIDRIVVAPTDINLPETAARATSLADALRQAKTSQADLIELAQPVIVSGPIRIPRDGLTIRSLVGATEIRFVAEPMPAMEQSVMVEVGSHRIDFQNIHFNWNVRSGSLVGGTLFALNDNKMVRLTGCTITIENLAQRDEVFAFEITAPRLPRNPFGVFPAEPFGLPESDSPLLPTRTDPAQSGARTSTTPRTPIPPLVAIELNHVAARGEMTLINLIDPVQLQLGWDNGLLAVSRRMLDVAGVDIPTSSAGNQIQLSLNRVTASTGEGMIRTRLGPSGKFPMAIDRDSRNAVFHSPDGAPHVEFSNLEPAEATSPEMLVNLRGENNAYDSEQDWPILSWSTTSGSREVFWMSQMIVPSRPPWMGERSPRWIVRWSLPFDESTTASRLTLVDFYQDGTVVAGFDRAVLPEFPTRMASDDSLPVVGLDEPE